MTDAGNAEQDTENQANDWTVLSSS